MDRSLSAERPVLEHASLQCVAVHAAVGQTRFADRSAVQQFDEADSPWAADVMGEQVVDEVAYQRSCSAPTAV